MWLLAAKASAIPARWTHMFIVCSVLWIWLWGNQRERRSCAELEIYYKIAKAPRFSDMGSSACGCISGSRAQWLIRSKYSILICVQQLHTVSHSVILENGGALAENCGSLPENGGSIPENGWFSSGERVLFRRTAVLWRTRVLFQRTRVLFPDCFVWGGQGKPFGK